MDFHLRQHVEAFPSFIKDTTYCLQKMTALNLLPSNTTLITMDVTPSTPIFLIPMASKPVRKFDGDHYLQINAQLWAPKWLHLMLIHLWENLRQLLESYRFIYNVDMKWSQSDEELQSFLSRANNLHPSIKFTHELSNTTISFLDTSSSLSEGELSTDLYSIPTDTNQYLLPSSCHPPGVTKSIPYSQALRIRRICSTDKSLKKTIGST